MGKCICRGTLCDTIKSSRTTTSGPCGEVVLPSEKCCLKTLEVNLSSQPYSKPHARKYVFLQCFLQLNDSWQTGYYFYSLADEYTVCPVCPYIVVYILSVYRKSNAVLRNVFLLHVFISLQIGFGPSIIAVVYFIFWTTEQKDDFKDLISLKKGHILVKLCLQWKYSKSEQDNSKTF